MMHQVCSHKKVIYTLTAMVFVLVAAAACSPKQKAAPANQQTTTHTENDGHDHQAGAQATAAMCSEHKVRESECPFCNKSLVEKSGICQEHGVPEALCTRCKPALEAAFKAAGDWCGEHKLPESQCTACNPDLLKKKAPDAHAGEAPGAHAGEAPGAHAGEAPGAHAGEAAAAHEDEATLTPEAIVQNGIKIEAASKKPLGEVYTVPARISFNTEQMAHVGTPVTGRVAEIKVKLGDMVKKGDELLVIDSPALGEAQSDYLQKKTQVQVAQSALEVAQTAAERAKRLYEGKGIALGEYQKRDGDLKAARGAVKSAEAALTAAENSLHLWGIGQAEIALLIKTGEINPRYAVRAPLGGSVIKREATLGEIVGPDRDALLVLADMKTLWVLADVPENTIHQIAPGAPALVNVESLKGLSYPGKVTYIAPELDTATRTAQVRVEVPDGNTPLKPGMFAQVSLTLGHQEGKSVAATIAVPEAAVQTFEGGPCVFVEVPGEPNTFAKQAVKIGPTVDQMAPILSGLEEGKRYVSAGAFIVKAEIAKGIMEGKTCSGH